MKISILTIFPEMFTGAFSESIIKRAVQKNLVEIEIIDFREYSLDPHKKVDDTPYGGGAGMVLSCEPIFRAIRDIKTPESKVIILTPSGIPYKQKMAYDLSKEKHLILLCGHYEGFDERIMSLADAQISIGDYVLTGGELPAAVIVDSVVRLLPGAINERSHINDSFNEQFLLDYPTYTKPREFEGMSVPDVLVNGNHAEIDKWRYEQSVKKTKEVRPDLID